MVTSRRGLYVLLLILISQFPIKAQFPIPAMNIYNPSLQNTNAGTNHLLITTILNSRSGKNDHLKILDCGVKGLTDIKRLNFVFDYSGMKICNASSRDEYYQNIRKKHKAEKAESIIGEWNNMPLIKFEDTFLSVFNKKVYDSGIQGFISELDTISAGVIVELIQAEPDYHSENIIQNPYLKLIYTFLEPNGDLIVRFSYISTGSVKVTHTEIVADCFEKAAKVLGEDLVIKLKKLNEPEE